MPTLKAYANGLSMGVAGGRRRCDWNRTPTTGENRRTAYEAKNTGCCADLACCAPGERTLLSTRSSQTRREQWVESRRGRAQHRVPDVDRLSAARRRRLRVHAHAAGVVDAVWS